MNSLISSGLKLDKIRVESAIRKQSKNENKPGIVVAVCKSLNDKNSIMQKKRELRSLDTEANRFYDRNHQMYDAALLTRCYTQHALRPFIDSESNHIRSFIKIPFINKGIDFIDLPSIFQDKSVIQSIPTYFQNSEPPTRHFLPNPR